MSRPRRRLALLLPPLCLLAIAACSPNPPILTLTPAGQAIAPELAAATFDSAWTLIDRNHFDPAHGGVDWPAVRDELRPRALATTSLDSLRAVIDAMLARTGLSHFSLIPGDAVDALRTADDDPAASREGSVGLDLRLIDGEVVVWRVDAGSPAAAAGVRPGWVLEAVDETRFAEVLARTAESLEPEVLAYRLVMLANARLDGAVGREARLTLRDGDDAPQVVTVMRTRQPGEVNQLGNLPPIRTRLEHELMEADGRRVAVIRFNIWLLPIAAAFDDAIDQYRDADALVIDLRGNLGGVGGMAMGLAGHFLDEPVSLGEMRTRQSTLKFRVNPRRSNAAGQRVAPFSGPVAVLQDALSMSTSEIFAQGLQTVGRARVFGETSAGAALPSRLERLPSGDVLQFAFADFVDPAGTRLEGRGVVPDEVVPLSRATLLAGQDAPLDAALRWIDAYLDAVERTEPRP